MSNVYRLDDYRTPKAADEPVATSERKAASEPKAKLAQLATALDRGISVTELLAMPAAERQALIEMRRMGREEAAERRRRAIEIIRSRQPPPPERNPLQAGTAVLLHSVSWGRNAWNSTWIQRYRPGTLCDSRAASMRFVDANRKQGSAYRETVMPGWHLQFDRRAYLVCEINTRRPFDRLLAPDFLVVGITEAEALRMLDPTSTMWRGRKPDRDSIIVQETTLPVTAFAAWGKRTTHPGQQRTPGRYERAINRKEWLFRAVEVLPGLEYDVSAFEAIAASAPTD